MNHHLIHEYLCLYQKLPLSFIMTDIDHFKQVNDTYGHDAGDIVLKQVALMLRGISQERSYAVRMGGDEMCVVLPEVSHATAWLLADRVRRAIEATLFKFSDSGSVKITFSFGIGELDTNTTMKELMKKADVALYQAKQSGRNRVTSFDFAAATV